MTNDKSSQEATRLANQRAQIAEAQFDDAKNRQEFTPEEILAALHENEFGDATLLKKAMAGRFVRDAKRDQFFRFQGGHWQQDLEGDALTFAIQTLRDLYTKEAARQKRILKDPEADEGAQKKAKYVYDLCKKRLDRVNTLKRTKNVLTLATTGRNELVISGDEWNANPWALAAQDKIVDLRTGESRQGTPGDYINKAAPTAWNGLDTPCPTWQKFLYDVFDKDVQLIGYVQRVLGTALTGQPNHQEFYILHGAGRNGKGTILETLKEVLGDGLAGSVKSEMIIENKQGTRSGADTEILDLQGKRIVWASESSKGKKLNSEKIKLFSGGDTLSGRPLYSNNIITFSPTHTLFLLTNYKPRIGEDTAVWDRLRLIPFKIHFTDEPKLPNDKKKDIALKNKLLQEASGILTWLVKGCLWAQEEGLMPPPVVMESGEEYRLDEDPIRQFIQETCELKAETRTQAGPLYDAFKKWHEEKFGTDAYIPTQKKALEQFRAYPGIERKEEARHTFYHGIRVIGQL